LVLGSNGFYPNPSSLILQKLFLATRYIQKD
jgi:hypothetical protein